MVSKKIKEMSRAELEQETAYFHMLLEAFPFNLFIKDTDCKYQITSRVCDMLNGVERGGLKGLGDFDLQNSDEIAQNFYGDDCAIMATKEGSHLLSPTLCGNTIKYYDIYKEPLIGEDGSVAGILGLVVDPGDTVQMTERNESDVNKMTEMFLNVDSFIFDYDLAADQVMILKQLDLFSNLLQFDLKSGKEVLAAPEVPEESARIIRRQIQKLREGEKQQDAMISLLASDGTEHICTLRFTSVFDTSMKPVRAIGILTEVSPDSIEEEDMRLTLDSMQAAFTRIAGERFETMLFIFSRYMRYHMISNTYHEIPETGTVDGLYRHLNLRIHPDDQSAFVALLKDERDHMELDHSMELRMGKADSYRWKEIQIHAMHGPDGVTVNFLITISDIDDMVRVRKQKEIRQVNNQVIEVLSSVVESRDLESGNHIHRIKNVTGILLREILRSYPEYNLNEDEIEIIVSASAMHDIGKIAIPDMILLKPGKLTPEEFNLMKLHTVRGAEIINSASLIQDKKYYQYCYDICLHHHERYDGSGYPEHLKGDEISIAAQVVSLADVYDALINKRCYKAAYPEDETIRMILDGECGCFNPKLLDCLNKSRDELKRLYSTVL